MLNATNLKNGTTFSIDGVPYKVIKYTHQKIGRGGATVKLRVRNLNSGNLESKTMNSSVKVDEISTQKTPLQFLYKDEDNAVFMNPETYEQVELSVDLIENELPFIKEGSKVDILFWDSRPLSVEIPPKVTLEVTEADPGVKGDTASNVYKPAKLENGITVKVPLFINTRDKVRVDTRTGEYIERAK